MTPEGPDEQLRRRQKSRAFIMAVLLFAFAALIYFISIAKMAAE